MLTLLILSAVACQSKKSETDKSPETVSEVKQEGMMGRNLLEFPQIWEAAADEYGSTFTEGEPFINDERLEVSFTIAKKEGDYYPYVELKSFPEVNYSEVNHISISYACAHGLTIKLNQSDFSAGGDESYAHYQYTLPATDGEPHTAVIALSDFTQPDWAPEASRAIALNLENILAIYFVPNIDYDKGESTTLTLYSVELN